MMENNTEKKEGIFDKIKNAVNKFLKGTKEVAVKTARINSENCYGFVLFIGYLLAYDDHALISFIGRDDVIFKKENVLSYGFAGLGDVLHDKATVNYSLTLDDNVQFSKEVSEKYDVKNVTVAVYLKKLREHLIGSGSMEYGTKACSNGLRPIEECDVYKFDNCLVLAFNLQEHTGGDHVRKYQDSALYSFSNIESIDESERNTFIVKFNNGKSLTFTAKNKAAYETVKSIEIK